MKKKMLALVLGFLIFGFLQANTTVNEKVLKVFNETFKEAKNVEWFQSEDHYVVNFLKDDIRYNVSYDKEGNFLNLRRYYLEDKLPMYILFKLKRKYKDKNVYGVTEVMDNNGVYYHITLEDKLSWWVVKVTSQDFMEITEKLRKP
jgi:hypothetical protein